MSTLLEEYERELLHVQGNYPEDEQRIKDIKAAIAHEKKEPTPPLASTLPVQEGERRDGVRAAGVREDPHAEHAGAGMADDVRGIGGLTATEAAIAAGVEVNEAGEIVSAPAPEPASTDPIEAVGNEPAKKAPAKKAAK